MRWWGRVLVSVTILLTGLGILLTLLSFRGTTRTVAIVLISIAILAWVILILCYLETISRLRKNLDGLITKGVWIKARLTSTSEATYDKYSSMIREWVESVDKTLKGTEYEHSWRFDVGLTNPEDESQLVVLERLNAVDRNYMFRRLTRLKEIRDSL